jgi:large-conductance mechanosensitive channel
MHNLWNDFKKFIMQGDLVAIASRSSWARVQRVVDSVVNDIVNPIIGRSSASRPATSRWTSATA